MPSCLNVLIPNNKIDTDITLEAEINGTKYKATAPVTGTTTVGTPITLDKVQ